MSWRSLDQVYLQESAGKSVGKLPRQRVLGEEVSIYSKQNDKQIQHIGDVGDEYYNKVVKTYVNMGSNSNTDLRAKIEEKLERCNGNIDNNADIWQRYMMEGEFDMSDDNFKSSEQLLLDYIKNDQVFYLDNFIEKNWPQSDVTGSYFKPAFATTPEAPRFGRAGEGELYLAYFCNGTKPDKGDLHVAGIDIELKGKGGRLFKANVKKDFSHIQKDFENDDDILDGVTDFICDLSGTQHIKQLVREIVQTFSDDIISEYNFFKQRGRLITGTGTTSSRMIYIGGLAQLYSYQQVQKFDVFSCFINQGNDQILFKLIDMRDVNSLIEIHQAIDTDAVIKFAMRSDGIGWSFANLTLK